ncbi:hypothetical protein J1D01_11450 [Seonamhaeicola sp. NFXS20]|uniref:hypothetical protein n=1 Tax=Seonamhaeicola sp. NFXS20 TaxID=2816959 RepID=UPI003B8B616B
MGQDKIPTTKKRIKFLETYGDLDDSETLKELLYANKLQVEKLEKIRSNTSMLVWWLVAIPVFFVILAFALGGFGALL